jgi:hypothetical protein
MYFNKNGVKFMTEIIIKKIENKGFCAIDNHNAKNGKEFTIIFRARSMAAVEQYLQEKGIKYE